LSELKENNSTKFKIIEDEEFIKIYRGFTNKQRDVYEYILSEKNNFFIATHGAVRVGKTYSTSLAILKLIEDHINTGKEGSIILMGKSLTSLHRNILEPMSKWKLNIDIPVSSKSTIWKITETFSVHLSGYGTTACEAIRGITASLIYIDEISNVTEDNFNSILLTRASLPYSKIISTSNPISSHHWYAQMFKKLESGEFNKNRTRYSKGFRFNLLTDKNSAISDDYITGLTQAYGKDSAIYKRNVLGLDVNQESSIFNIDENEISKVVNLDEKLVSEVVIGHDKGFSSPMVYVAVFGYKEKLTDSNLKFHVDSILYYQKGHGSYTKPSDYKVDLDKFLKDKRQYNPIIVFPHDAGADIQVIKERNNVVCKPNYKKCSVLNGIEYMRELFNKGILTVDPSCKELIYELFSYKYDEKALEEKHTEKVLKENDHSVDALRYALVSMKAFHKSKEKGTYEF
jgi:PBSX family phage terminase large subunit